jgi:hypothetical protein
MGEAAQPDESLIAQTKESMSTLGHAGADGMYEGGAEGLDAHSPSRRMFGLGKDAADGLANGFEQGMADENRNPLAPPPPPEVGYMPDDNSMRGRIRGLGKNIADKAADSRVGKFAGKKLAQASGNAITDSKGQVYYDPNEDPDTWAGKMTAEDREFRAGLPGGENYNPETLVADGAPLPVKVVDGFEMDPKFQEVMEEGNIQTEQLDKTMARNAATNDETSKETAKTDRMQRRGALAGKMMGGLGTVTMAAGMATQVGGVVGETAQAMVGPLAALTGILPILTAMGPLWGTLLAVIGGGIALWLRHNSAVKEARREAYELAKAMGTGKDAIQKFADFSGRVTSGEVSAQRRRNRQNPLQLQPGQKTFGSAFVEDDAGQALVESTRNSLQKLGKDSTIQSLYTQLGTAVTQGALSTQEAVSIAAALSEELGDYSIGMSVNGKLTQLLGPNGENVLTEPLKIETQAKLAGESLEASADTLARSFETVQMFTGQEFTPGGYQGGYTGGPTSVRVVTDETGQAMVEAEYQERIAEAGDGFSGWLKRQQIWFDKNSGLIADQLRGEALGTSMGVFGNNLELAAQAIDTQRLSSQKLIDQAIEDGATAAEIAALRQEEADAIDELTASLATANEQLFSWWNDLPEADRDEARKDQEDRIVAKAEESGGDTKQVRADLIRLRSKTNDQEEMRVNMVIRSAYESGALSETQFQSVIDNFNNPEEKEIISNLILGLGPGETGNLMGFLDQIDNEDLQTEILLGFKGADTEDALERITDLDNLFKTSPIFDGVDIPVNFFTSGEGDLEETLNKADEVRALAAQDKLFDGEGNIDMGAYAGIVGEDVAARAATVADSIGEEFDNLDAAGKLEFFTNFAINAQFSGDPDAIAFYKNQSDEMGLNLDFGSTGSAQEASASDRVLGEQIVNYIPQTRTLDAPGTDSGDDSNGGGGSSSFDELLVGLRNTRQATIDMKSGWDGMQESLQKFLDSGAVGFNGLANQMRSFGVGEGLIERITGMDPDEYEKRKGELFVFDEAGNITGTTQKLQNMGAAMNKLALGEYLNNQQSFIENTNNQFTAMQMLTAQGLSFVDAYEMVQDQALATAIAMGATREEIDELIRITEQMTDMQERYNKLSEKEQAAKAVRQTNKEFNERVAVLQKLSKEQGKYSDEEIDKVLNDANLTKIFLDPSIDPKTLKQALENARRAADLELRIKVATEEGKKGLFDELVGGVQDEFNRQESKIDIDFRLATRDDQDIVDQAQNQIAAIQYQIDDYEAQLKGIEDQEEVINEKYDDRYKALEEVAAANERIQRIRSAELDIADALSRGDIAAAARAQQELKATQAQNAAESEKEMLQKQQEAELARVRSASGSSREDLENKIKALQDEIFGVEEDSLEPAQERIRLAEIEKKAQVDALEVSGKTRDEWDQIANLTDIATQNTEEFAKNVERALALFEYFVNGAPLDLGLFGDEMTAQLEAMGVDVGQEKAVAAAADFAKSIDFSSEQVLTPVQEKALEIQDFNKRIEALKLDGPGAAAESERLLRAAGFDPNMVTADRAQDVVNSQREKELAEIRKLQYEASKEFADMSGGRSVTALEQSYRAAVLGAGGSTNVGKPAPAPAPRSSSSSSSASRPSTSVSRSTAVATNAGVSINRTTADAAERTIKSYSAANPWNSAVRAQNVANSQQRFNASGMSLRAYMRSAGGIIPGYSVGGRVKGYSAGGFPSLGSDNIPAMLTPGEFVVRKRAVQDFGVKNLEAVNNGEYSGGSVYNYSLAVNVKSDADPNRIAKTVMKEIKRVDSQRVRGNRI